MRGEGMPLRRVSWEVERKSPKFPCDAIVGRLSGMSLVYELRSDLIVGCCSVLISQWADGRQGAFEDVEVVGAVKLSRLWVVRSAHRDASETKGSTGSPNKLKLKRSRSLGRREGRRRGGILWAGGDEAKGMTALKGWEKGKVKTLESPDETWRRATNGNNNGGASEEKGGREKRARP